MRLLQLLAVCLLTQLGSTLSQDLLKTKETVDAEDNRSARTKRGGLSSFIQRRQSDIGSETGQIAFSIPFLKALGLPQPIVPSFTDYFGRRVLPRIDVVRHALVPSVISTLADLGQKSARMAKTLQRNAEPLMIEHAIKFRRTMDETIAPGLAAVGKTTYKAVTQGMDTLTDVVMEPEEKAKLTETMAALGTITKAAMGIDEEEEARQDVYDQIGEESKYHQFPEYYDESHNFQYQQVNPDDYSIQYPPQIDAYNIEYNQHPAVPLPVEELHYPDLNPRRDPSFYHINNPHYVPHYTTNNNATDPQQEQSVEEALYILGKNIFGQNVTDRIFPVAKRVAVGFNQVGEGLSTITNAIPLPSVEFDASGVRVKTADNTDVESHYDYEDSAAHASTSRDERFTPPVQEVQRNPQGGADSSRVTSGAPRCTTPERSKGRCMDIQNCPLLLADLDKLRKSICFKSLFVPGVCCPEGGVELLAVDEDLNVVNEVQEILPQGTTDSSRPDLPSLAASVTTTARPVRPSPARNFECGVTKVPQSRIVGGNATFEGEYPWMAAIYLHGKGRREFWCGGALITPNHVITAAHCTRDSKKRPFRPVQFTVRLGEWDLTDNDKYSEEFRVLDYKAHPNFRPNGFYNDVAVFTLDQPVRFTAHIQPICLPDIRLRNQNFVNSLPIALGWGTTHYGGEEVSKLRGVPLPVWKNKDCDDAYFQPITEVFLCAGYADGGRDACQGDSGGPLMLYDEKEQKWNLIGIVSFGNRCAEPGYPGVYTRITYFMDFIESVIA